MKQKLARRTDNELLVRVVMARLKENGQLDDERYAKQFTRNRTESRKQGKFALPAISAFAAFRTSSSIPRWKSPPSTPMRQPWSASASNAN